MANISIYKFNKYACIFLSNLWMTIRQVVKKCADFSVANVHFHLKVSFVSESLERQIYRQVILSTETDRQRELNFFTDCTIVR